MRTNLVNQVTSIECLEDNQFIFNKLMTNLKYGRGDEVVRDMMCWAKSDRDPLPYECLLDMAKNDDERIVYDDGNYIITSSNSIIVLYEYVEEEKSDYDKAMEAFEEAMKAYRDAMDDYNKIVLVLF